MAEKSERALSFGTEATTYDGARPEYPAAAVAWLLKDIAQPARVADIGAGTGKLTRVLASQGAEVTAVDPDPGMLDHLREVLPGVAAAVGRGEDIPLPDAALDLVTFGQAWHWVDPRAASAESARVLAPGGSLALLWNIRDSREPWVSRMSEIMTPSDAEALIAGGGPEIAAPFGDTEHEEWTWRAPVTRAHLMSLAHSRSYLITAPQDERARIDRELTALFDDLGLSGDQTVDLPYTTHVFRAARP